MSNPINSFNDILHHLVDYSRFDNETDLNLCHVIIDQTFPAPVAAAPAAEVTPAPVAAAPAAEVTPPVQA